MSKKSLIICSILSCFVMISGLTAFFYSKFEKKATETVVQKSVKQAEAISTKETAVNEGKNNEDLTGQEVSKVLKNEPLKLTVNKDEAVQDVPRRKAKLYADDAQIPFSAIAGLADLPDVVSKSINKIKEKNELYYLGKNKDKTLIIVGTTEKYSRHDLEFVEIDVNGKPKIIPFGSHAVNDAEMGGEWVFDEVTKLPLKHVKHNSKGMVEYTEIWNYSSDEPIKYEMKDREGKVVSVKKETQDGDENIRLEHLIYDSHGKTMINVSANYEGPNLTRFTYYNAQSPDDGVTLLNEFSNDGLKIKESVYSSDYSLKNTYRAEYKDGERVNLKISDKDDIVEILSED